jgi:hypothetical protein
MPVRNGAGNHCDRMIHRGSPDFCQAFYVLLMYSLLCLVLLCECVCECFVISRHGNSTCPSTPLNVRYDIVTWQLELFHGQRSDRKYVRTIILFATPLLAINTFCLLMQLENLHIYICMYIMAFNPTNQAYIESQCTYYLVPTGRCSTADRVCVSIHNMCSKIVCHNGDFLITI